MPNSGEPKKKESNCCRYYPWFANSDRDSPGTPAPGLLRYLKTGV